ncbi:hypothetical protein K1719_013217 [Acacia pycnantha]|nr:hypothetical protein K1719_013217 [Acacia pycnantha]
MNFVEAEDQTSSVRNRSASDSFMIGMVMRIYRARWFVFMRRVFQYQNESRSDMGSNPFNSVSWMIMELVVLVVQITASTVTLAISQEERPVWPMRFWILGYEICCVDSLLLLFWRYRLLHLDQSHALRVSDLEQQRGSDEEEETRKCEMMNKWRSSMEVMNGIWFVMGNVWVFRSGFGSIDRAPKLNVLCFSLLSWNAISYSFPFILFLLICCFFNLLSCLTGRTFHFSPSHASPASQYQISLLPSFPYASPASQHGSQEDHECCICLAKYRENEQVRQLPCSHMFHQNCVDQWLSIVTCCPLCKQGIDN